MSSSVLSTSKNGDSITTSSKLQQCLATLIAEELFLIFKWNFLSQFALIASCLGYHWESMALLYTLPSGTCAHWKYFSQDFSGGYTIPVLRLFWYGQMRQPLHFHGLGLSTAGLFSVLWEAKNWIQCFRGGPTWAEQRGRITSLDQLGNALSNIAQDAVGCLCFRGAHWLIANLLSTTTHRSFSAKLLSNYLISSLYYWTGLFHPWCRILLNFVRFLPVHLSRLSQSWMAAQVVCQPLLPIMYCL